MLIVKKPIKRVYLLFDGKEIKPLPKKIKLVDKDFRL